MNKLLLASPLQKSYQNGRGSYHNGNISNVTASISTLEHVEEVIQFIFVRMN